jgi:hypothetical protein
MSASSSSKVMDAASLTRQQLDELDALLQRMLELPVHPFDEEPARAEPAVAVATSVLEPEPEPQVFEPLPAPAEVLSEPSFSFRTEPENTAAAAVPEDPEPSEDDLELAPPLWLWPLIGINQVFDLCVGGWGSPGRWLRRPLGRALIGWTGVVFLAAALGLLILDWVRWNW